MIRKIPVVYKDAAGIWWEDRFRPYVCMVVNVVLNIVLVQIIGISGIILSSIFSLLVSIPWENSTIFKNVFHQSSREYYGKQIGYLFTMFLGGFLTWEICSFFADSIGTLFLRGVICLIVPNTVFVALNHRRQEFKDSVAFVVRILKRQY